MLIAVLRNKSVVLFFLQFSAHFRSLQTHQLPAVGFDRGISHAAETAETFLVCGKHIQV